MGLWCHWRHDAKSVTLKRLTWPSEVLVSTRAPENTRDLSELPDEVSAHPAKHSNPATPNAIAKLRVPIRPPGCMATAIRQDKRAVGLRGAENCT